MGERREMHIIRIPKECSEAVEEIQKIMKDRIGFAPQKTEVAQMAIADYYAKQLAIDVIEKRKGDEQ